MTDHRPPRRLAVVNFLENKKTHTMSTVILTDAQPNKALRCAAIEAVAQFCRVRGIEVGDPNLIPNREAEKMTGCSRKSLGTLAERGEIKRVRVGGVWKYDRESILEYLREHGEA